MRASDGGIIFVSGDTASATRTGGSSSSSVAAIEEREQTDGGGAMAIRIAPEFSSKITSLRRWPVREPRSPMVVAWALGRLAEVCARSEGLRRTMIGESSGRALNQVRAAAV